MRRRRDHRYPCGRDGVATGVKLVLPQFPCCRACTLKADPGKTWIHVHGARSHVLDFTVLCSALAQGDAGAADTRARDHRGGAATGIGGCPVCCAPSRRVHSWYRRLLHDLPWQGRPVIIHVAARRFLLPQPPLRPADIRGAPDRRGTSVWPPDRTIARSPAPPRSRARRRSRRAPGDKDLGADKPGHAVAPGIGDIARGADAARSGH